MHTTSLFHREEEPGALEEEGWLERRAARHLPSALLCATGRPQGSRRLLPSSIPFLSLVSLPSVMLSAQHSHPDSYLSRGIIANANSRFLWVTSRPAAGQPRTCDVEPE